MPARQTWGDGIAVHVVVGRSLGQARDLFVACPSSRSLAMRVGVRFRDGTIVGCFEVYARLVVRRCAARTCTHGELPGGTCSVIIGVIGGCGRLRWLWRRTRRHERGTLGTEDDEGERG